MPIKNKREADITLKEIKISKEGKHEESNKYVKDGVGRGNPIVTYSGELNIAQDDIINIELHNDKFLPWIKLRFRDKSNKSIDELFPTDDIIVSFFLRSTSENNRPIRMDFKITDFNPNKTKAGQNFDIIYNLEGQLDVDFLYYRNFISYNDTSYKTLEKISKEASLGWSTNISNTNDEMTWINPGQTYLDFIKKITKNAYSEDNTFLFSFIDFYYNLNFIDIENQLQENISEQKSDWGTNALGISGDEKKTKLKLSNHPDYSPTNLYIRTFSIDNSSTKINLMNGYQRGDHYYDTKDVKYVFKKLDSISDEDDNLLSTKVKPKRERELISEYEYLGKLDKDNAHENYLFAYEQNIFNLDFLQKIKMVITLEQPNYSLYRFQKVLVELYNLTEMDAREKNKENDENKLNNKLSGEWLITGINFTYKMKTGPVQQITLARRSLSYNYNKAK